MKYDVVREDAYYFEVEARNKKALDKKLETEDYYLNCGSFCESKFVVGEPKIEVILTREELADILHKNKKIIWVDERAGEITIRKK